MATIKMTWQKQLMAWKVRGQRAMSYFQYLNLILLLFLTVKQYTLFGVSLNNLWIILPLGAVALAGLLGFGYIEGKFGFHQGEADYNQRQSPLWVEMRKEVKEINEKLEKMSK